MSVPCHSQSLDFLVDLTARLCGPLLCLALAGCVAVPLEAPDLTLDKRIASLRAGSTTRAQALAALGTPKIAAGRFILTTVHTVPFVILTTGGGGGPYGGNVVERILLHFDERNVTDRVVIERADGSRVVNGVATPEPAGADAEARPRSRLIFHSTRHNPFFQKHADMFDVVAVSRDGRWIAASQSNNTVWRDEQVWLEDLETGVQRQLTVQAHIEDLEFSPDGTRLAVLARSPRILDLTTGKQIAKFSGHGDSVWVLRGATALAFAPRGGTVASGGAQGMVRLWDPRTGREKLSFRAHDDWISSVAYAPDGTLLATVGADNRVRFWDPELGTSRGELLRTGPADTVAFSADGRWLAVATRDHVEVWRNVLGQAARNASGTPVADGPARMFVLPVVPLSQERTPYFRGLSVAISPDGGLVLACSGGAAIWDLETGDELWRQQPYPLAPGSVRARRFRDCTFSAAGKFVAMAGLAGELPYGRVSLRDLSALIRRRH